MKGSFKAAMVGVALASHIANVYIVGAARDAWLCGYTANLGSILFTLSVALLVVEQNLLPKTMCPLPCFFIQAYNLLAVIFMTSMALRLIWLPLSYNVVRMNQQLASALCGISAMNQPPLNAIIKFLECPNFQMMELLGLSIYILWVVIIATGAQGRIQCWINQMLTKCDDGAPQMEVPMPEPCCDSTREDEPEDVEDEEEEDAPRRRRNRY